MIKNLIFDLGGVIYEIKRELAVEAFQEIGLAVAGELLGISGHKGPFLALESGNITPRLFRNELRRLANTEMTDEQIDDALNAFLVRIPLERLRQLKRLREHYGIYLLSNTNAIMWYGKIIDGFKADGHDISYYFDDMIVSFEERLCKPDPSIFRRAVVKFGIIPSETVFFDDSMLNVEAAEAIGFHGVHVSDTTPFDLLIGC